jgi:hypothetical protein
LTSISWQKKRATVDKVELTFGFLVNEIIDRIVSNSQGAKAQTTLVTVAFIFIDDNAVNCTKLKKIIVGGE